MRRYLSTMELAERWGYTRETVLDWCQQGLLKGTFKERGRWLIPIETIAEAEKKECTVLQREYGNKRIDLTGKL